MEADVFYFDINPTYDNSWEFWCSWNPQLLINQYSTQINNPLIAYEDATFLKQATFDNFTPVCSLASPTAVNHLTRKDYVDNNFVNKTTNQTGIAGDKTFTGRLTNSFVIFAKDLSWLDAQGSSNRVQSYLSGTDLGFISVNVYNNRYFFQTLDGAGSPSNPMIISSASTIIANNLISNSQATFNNFCPKTDKNPAVENDLVKLSYLKNNFRDLSTTQDIGGEKTFTDDITAPNIYCNTALYFRDINLSLNKALIFHQSDIVYFDTLTTYDNYWKFKCSGTDQLIISQLNTTIENKLKCKSELIHKETQVMNKVKKIVTISPPTFEFPLEEWWMFTSTGQHKLLSLYLN